MFENKNYREWSIWKHNSSLEDNFYAVVEEMTGRAFWLKNEIYWFLAIYSVSAIPVGIGNAIYEHWSFNSVLMLIIVISAFWFCFMLRREIQTMYLTGGPRIEQKGSDSIDNLNK